MNSPEEKDLDAGQKSLARGDWQEAHDHFEAALAAGDSPEALEGLGWALWWLDHPQRSFDVREKAYRLYADRNEGRAAARVATALAVDIYDYQGKAVTNGWLRRAHRHLDGLETGPEGGWLALWEGHFARLVDGDVTTARECASKAAAIGRSHGQKDLEMLAIALEGYALVSEGKVDEGMRRLDEATAAAMAGEITDLDAAGAACCFLMHACEQVRDLDRAAQWAERVNAFSRRWRIRPLYAICRVHYAVVLIGRGEWTEAERALTEVLEEVSAEHGPARSEANLHLAELRRRQGRYDEATTLFTETEGFSLSLIGRALMALEDGDARTAATFLSRSLRRVAEDNWTVRATALQHLARAQARSGSREDAKATLEQLQALADIVRTDYLQATARQAAGCWMAEEGETEGARHAFEDAIDLFDACRAPFEASRARIDLARLLLGTEHRDLARTEAQSALETATRLGASVLREEAASVLASPAGGEGPGSGSAAPTSASIPDPPVTAGTLTKRETEILGLVGEGLGDKEIASRLHLSEHTVHRHVSNILLKLEAPSRAAAVALAIRRGLI